MKMGMQKAFLKTAAALLLAFGFGASVHAIPVTINMTADNFVGGGGLCVDSTCENGTSWGTLNGDPLANASNWQQSDSVTIDLGVGIHYFAWHIFNSGSPSTGNPAALLAEILWSGNANYSSSAWEVFNQGTGAFIANATEYGNNGTANIWTNVNGGNPVAGISTNASWIYTANNFANADQSAWIRTSIAIAGVPEPGVLSLMAAGLIGLVVMRRKAAV